MPETEMVDVTDSICAANRCEATTARWHDMTASEQQGQEGNCTTPLSSAFPALFRNLTAQHLSRKTTRIPELRLPNKGRKRKRKLSGREGSRGCVSYRQVFVTMFAQRDFIVAEFHEGRNFSFWTAVVDQHWS